ncbi:VUT family protein [Salmonella enterica]|nr:VUT family protein [Salmonella enterica]EJH7438211.1 VUT family protein [Salmonella enterica]EJH7877505.1 VUT family protein [Salmonella enterica]EJI6710219.1 VUT family protein [Salmonella enterica]
MAAFIYVLAICAANYLLFLFGPWWSIVNSFFLIGLDFILRDVLHERIGFLKVTGLAILCGGISYTINPAGGMIAIASSVSFVLASLGDGSVYQLLIRKSWPVKSNASNITASAIDSLTFPLIAFGSLVPGIFAGQFIAKVGGGFIWSLLLRRK